MRIEYNPVQIAQLIRDDLIDKRLIEDQDLIKVHLSRKKNTAVVHTPHDKGWKAPEEAPNKKRSIRLDR